MDRSMRRAFVPLRTALLAALTCASAAACSSSPLDPRAIEAVERSHRQELIELCWLPAFHARPDIGEVALPVAFAISPDGVPQDVSIDRLGLSTGPQAAPNPAPLPERFPFSMGPQAAPSPAPLPERFAAPEAFAECVRARVADWRFPSSGRGAPRSTRTYHFQSQPDLPPSLTW